MIKILLQVCLTTLNVVCWFVPMKIRSFVESKRAIGMANAFSGGVFLSLAFGEPVNLSATLSHYCMMIPCVGFVLLHLDVILSSHVANDRNSVTLVCAC